MPASDAVDRFCASARAEGLAPEVSRYPDGTRTAVDAAAAVGCGVDQIVKSLVLMAGDQSVLVLCSGSRRVDLDALSGHLDQHVRMATAEEAREATGFAIGGTPPFGHPVPLRTIFDPHLATFDTVYAAAGTPDSVFAIDPASLMSITDAEPADVTS
ncbi:MAG: YbaK/EbsC family protein [Acidimicrobiia bacterium]|nr:YbaK/EbsC family protein [Acidimicrobiia bacterium]